MPTPTYVKILLVVPILACAAIFLALAGLVLLRNRPVMLRNRPVAVILTLLLAPIFLAVLRSISPISSPGSTCPAISLMGFSFVSMAFIWLSLSGYSVIGVNEASLRACLMAALAGLGLPSEETIGGFRLPSLGCTLQVRFQSTLDTASLRMESPRDKATLSRIAVAAREQFQLSRGSGSLNAAIFYGGTRLFFLILALYQWNRFG